MSNRIGTKPLSVDSAYRELSGSGLGGVVIFVGRVHPDRIPAGRMGSLLYEAHRAPALAAFHRFELAARRRPGVARVVLWHRVGAIRSGEASVIVGVAAPHRAQAFDACRYLIERLKVEAPIWKTARAPRAHRRRLHPRPSAARR